MNKEERNSLVLVDVALYGWIEISAIDRPSPVWRMNDSDHSVCVHFNFDGASRGGPVILGFVDVGC